MPETITSPNPPPITAESSVRRPSVRSHLSDPSRAGALLAGAGSSNALAISLVLVRRLEGCHGIKQLLAVGGLLNLHEAPAAAIGDPGLGDFVVADSVLR